MRMCGVAVLVIVSLFPAVRSQAADGDAKEEAVAKDLQAFKGTWRMSYREEDGKKTSEEEIKDFIGTSDGSGTFTVRRGGKLFAEATVKLDPAANPKTVDVTFTEGERKGKTVLGIYEMEADAFRVCVALPGDDRPAAFCAASGSGHTVVVYRREK
jgi:uncharacterized protein (TIGR03067 family)